MLKFSIFILIILIILISFYFWLDDNNNEVNYFILNPNMKIKQIEQDIFEIDDFYKYPNKIRNHYLKKDFKSHDSIYRTWYYNPELKNNFELINFFENLTNKKISVDKWNIFTKNNANGFLQYMTNADDPCIHTDTRSDYGGVVYLGDNQHPQSGTSFYQHKATGIKFKPTDKELKMLSPEKLEQYRYYNKNDLWIEGQNPQFHKWQKYYQCNNKFNRAIIFNSRRYHCAEKGYGTNKYNCRFFQTFFF
jgi:hypothetical protein